MRIATVGLAAILASAPGAVAPVMADVITVYNDRPSFEAAAGVPMTVEDFTPTYHFPISTGVLNSETNLPDIGIVPGTIQQGVTYSTPIGEGNFFNIDAGGYTGGFLDGFAPADRECTIDFHNSDPNSPRAVRAFGFDIGTFGSTDFDVNIYFSSGPMQHFNFPYPGTVTFFGFVSDAQDITRVVIGDNGNLFFAFDFDNFTYDEVGPAGLTLDLSGTCPGTMTVAWSNATPSSTLGIVFANNTGNVVIPRGPCSGTTLGLGAGGIRLVNTISSGSGSGQVNGNASNAACGHYLQLVAADGSPCSTSNVAHIQ